MVILSHNLWERRFGSERSILGRSLNFGGDQFEVIGVLPDDFRPVVSTGQYAPADVWMPLGYDPSLSWACRTCGHLRAIGRLAPGVTIEQASAELSAIQAGVRREHPGVYPKDERILMERFQDVYVGPVARRAFTVIGIALALLGLSTLATLSIMSLLRILGRRSALAIRAMLGATPQRLRKELVSESLILGLAGGAGAILVAFVINRVLADRFHQILPTLQPPRIDFVSIGFGIGIATLFGLAVGWIAAHDLSRLSVLAAVAHGPRGGTPSRSPAAPRAGHRQSDSRDASACRDDHDRPLADHPADS